MQQKIPLHTKYPSWALYQSGHYQKLLKNFEPQEQVTET